MDEILDPSSITISFEEERKCTINSCENNLKQHCLICQKCKRKVHYKCTLLPLYQLQQYVNFGTDYRKFTCVNCIEIQSDLVEIISEQSNSEEELKQELEKQRQLIKSYENELKKLKDALKLYENDDVNNPSKKRKINQESKELIAQNERLSDEITQLREESTNLKSRLEETQSELWHSDPPCDHDRLLEDIKYAMNNQFNEMERKFTKTVEQKIEAKQREDQSEMKASFADTIKKNLNEGTIENAIRDSVNNELVQETEKKKREKNLVIHGIVERKGTDAENEEHDKTFIASLLQILGTDVKPVKIIRLGSNGFGSNNKRPVKLIMQSTEDKDQIMCRLVNLKNAEEQYKAISVKDDYTLEERDLIRHWVKKAEEKNKKENTTEWKVRGTPKNGLRLVKVTKTRKDDQ